MSTSALRTPVILGSDWGDFQQNLTATATTTATATVTTTATATMTTTATVAGQVLCTARWRCHRLGQSGLQWVPGLFGSRLPEASRF